MAELKSKKGVEIFSAGKWNGDVYTEADLDAMVEAFKELGDGFPPPLKLGHADEQKILQNSGLPAAGWITNVYRKGKKLLADFDRMPSKIFELLENGAYRKVSSEIYWNLKIGKKLYKRVLGAVALLGADNPGVMNLDDILALYGLEDCEKLKTYFNQFENLKVYNYDQIQGEKDMGAEELKKLQDEKAALEAKLAKFEKEKADKAEATESQLAELKEYKAKAEKREQEAAEKLAKFEREAAEAKVDACITKLEKDNLVTDSMKPYIKALLGEEKKEYSLGEDKTVSKQELLEDLLKLSNEAAKVNFSENSNAGEKKEGKSPEDVLEEKVKNYMKENECDYRDAVVAVQSELGPIQDQPSEED